MELTAALIADLAALTAALDDPDVDLEAGVRALGDSVQGTVDSLLGVSLTVVVDGYPFTVTALAAGVVPGTTVSRGGVAAPTRIGASLRLPVPTLAVVSTAGTIPGGVAAGTVVFYAATPGAFVDLAADISHARWRPEDAVTLDADLGVDLWAEQAGGGLGELSTIHQAVGVLIARGDTPQTARVELERRAASSGVDALTAAAADVVASTAPWPPARC